MITSAHDREGEAPAEPGLVKLHRAAPAVRQKPRPGIAFRRNPARNLGNAMWAGLIAVCLCATVRGEDVKTQADRLKQNSLNVAKQLVRDLPKSVSAVQVLANVHKKQGNQLALLKCLRRCVELAPDRGDVQEQLGLLALESEDYTTAIQHFRQALSLQPSMAVAIRLADALLQTGEAEKAQAILEKVAREDPSGEASYLLGELLLQKQQLAAAKAAFERALKVQPNHVHAAYGMVKVSLQLGDSRSGEKYAARFEQLQNASAEINQQRRESYDDLTELRRQAAQTLTDAGRVYLAHDRSSDAERLWQQAAAMDGQDTACRLLLVRHYEATQRGALAIPLYRSLIELQPNNLSIYERLGLRLAAGGDLAGAEKTFLAMTRVPPHPARGYRMLAKFYLNSNKQLEQALKLAQRSVEIDPVADSHFVLGWALAKNGQFPAARVAMRQAMALDDSNPLYKKMYRSLPPSQK